MRSSARYWVFVLGLGYSLCAPASAGGVRVIRPEGHLNFSAIQPAIDIAQDGDIVLVGQGIYGGFTILDKSLCVMAVPGDDVLLQGQMAIRSLAEHRTVLIDGFRTDFFGGISGIAALSIEGNLGHVRIQNCALTGSHGNGDFWNGQKFEGGPGGPGAVLNENLHVAFVHSTIRGGTGWSSTELVASKGGDGGAGLIAQGSALALYDCTVIGGQGGYVDSNQGGNGGDGARVLNYGIFASDSSIRGANGGHTNSAGSGLPGAGGNGGDGLVVEPAAQAQLLDNLITAGAGGTGSAGGPNGQPGQSSTGGGVFHIFAGSATSFALGSAVSGDQVSIPLTVQGSPGDEVRVFRSALPGWRSLTPAKPGIVLVREPSLSALAALASVPGSGTLTAAFPLGELPPSVLARTTYSQGYVYDETGALTLASPMHFVTINRDAPPDCNANLLNDYVEMLEGGTDCNGNLVPDACDIASGTSPDVNGNGIPDECDDFPIFVDDSAPPGGNGSSSAPFQTLLQGILAAEPGDTILVRDGLYTGVSNRNLLLGTKELALKSESGPDNCIIDCMSLGRAFDINQGTKPSLRIEGFTIRNGNPGSAQGGAIKITTGGSMRTTISNCVFRDCIALGGGAVWIGAAKNTVLEKCTFINNTASGWYQPRLGGGALIEGTDVVIRDCSFIGNDSAGNGGGLFVRVGSYNSKLVSNCRFSGNTALRGAALGMFTSEAAAPGDGLSIQNCLFEGNRATEDGGGVHSYPSSAGGAVRILDSTFTGNSAARGGGLWTVDSSAFEVGNSIFWANAAPVGPQLGAEPLLGTPSVLDLSFCDVMGGQTSVYVSGGVLAWGPGNLDVDPLFSDPDYRLAPLSPCVDAGDNLAVPPDLADLDGDGNTSEPLPIDLDGNPRFSEVPSAPNTGNGSAPFVDMGPYERLP